MFRFLRTLYQVYEKFTSGTQFKLLGLLHYTTVGRYPHSSASTETVHQLSMVIRIKKVTRIMIIIKLPIVMFVIIDISGLSSIFTIHVYSPESADSTELRTFDDEYRVKEIISGLIAGRIAVPSGPVQSMLTATGTVTVDFISTVQVKVGEDPDSMGLGESE